MATSTPNLGLRKPDGIDVVNVETDLNANSDILDDAVQDLRVPAQGKLWRTSGVTGALAAAGTEIDFEASRVLNGMVAGAGNNGLIVPVSGMYKFTINGYGTGGGANVFVAFTVYRVRAAVANQNIGHLGLPKIDANDVTGSFSDVVPLAASDELRVKASASDSAVNAYGIDEVSGVRLFVEYKGPLSGATPI